LKIAERLYGEWRCPSLDWWLLVVVTAIVVVAGVQRGVRLEA
jgi:hypothetical protein